MFCLPAIIVSFISFISFISAPIESVIYILLPPSWSLLQPARFLLPATWDARWAYCLHPPRSFYSVCLSSLSGLCPSEEEHFTLETRSCLLKSPGAIKAGLCLEKPKQNLAELLTWNSEEALDFVAVFFFFLVRQIIAIRYLKSWKGRQEIRCFCDSKVQNCNWGRKLCGGRF